MQSHRIKTAVIGVGHLGYSHVEQLMQIPEAELAGVFDIDPEAAGKVQDRFDIVAFSSLEDTLNAVDAVSIVVPTEVHFQVAAAALEAGCHVFIEKPITRSLNEADELLRLAESQERLIQVGHIERLNPAVQVLSGYPLNPRFIEGHRLAPFNVRGTDVPVVLDLMIHDIDLVLALIKSPVAEVRANGVSVITNSVDIATARIEFTNKAVANLTASRISQKRMRKLRIFQTATYITIDFQQQLTEVYRLVDKTVVVPPAVVSMPLEFEGKQRQILYEKPAVNPYNALKRELSNFIRSVAGIEQPIVDGKAARSALDVAMRVQETILSQLDGQVEDE